jgi:hypothetical protein
MLRLTAVNVVFEAVLLTRSVRGVVIVAAQV